MINVAVIGIGRMGGKHARNLLKHKVKDSRLTAVCDIDEKKLRAFAERNTDIRTYDNYLDLLTKEKPDAIIIATPHYFHGTIAKAALERGVSVLSEKPITVTALEAREVVKMAEKHPEAIFAVMYNQRTNRMYKKAKKLIDEGKIGRITRVNFIITNWYRSQAYYDQGGWRASWHGEGGGTLINQCIHQLDILQWLVGMPKNITAKCKTSGRDISTENDVTALFEYGDFDCVFTASTHELPGCNRLEIVGDKGTIIINHTKMVCKLLKKSEPEVNRTTTEGYGRTGYKTKRMTYGLRAALHDSIIGQQFNVIKAFIKAVQNKDKDLLVARGDEGINALTIINAIYLSNWLGKTVELPMDDEAYAALLGSHAAAELI